jgi:hypothetical protein
MTSGARTVNVPVAGFHSSGLRTAPVSVNPCGCCWPPTTRTDPSGRTTLLQKARAYAMSDDRVVVTGPPGPAVMSTT